MRHPKRSRATFSKDEANKRQRLSSTHSLPASLPRDTIVENAGLPSLLTPNKFFAQEEPQILKDTMPSQDSLGQPARFTSTNMLRLHTWSQSPAREFHHPDDTDNREEHTPAGSSAANEGHRRKRPKSQTSVENTSPQRQDRVDHREPATQALSPTVGALVRNDLLQSHSPADGTAIAAATKGHPSESRENTVLHSRRSSTVGSRATESQGLPGKIRPSWWISNAAWRDGTHFTCLEPKQFRDPFTVRSIPRAADESRSSYEQKVHPHSAGNGSGGRLAHVGIVQQCSPT